ncbi:uncharacterized protein V1478_008370 [Vespula squamosa]|uniref:Uncharacterized protein n=1 Tax=Vespula squamosa TaxID=30214 RepID=A0ABD2ATB3_VESSQ
MSIIVLISLLKVTSALKGYDCTGISLNISTFSLSDVADCETPDLQPVNNTVFIQLLQASDYNMMKVLQCRTVPVWDPDIMIALATLGTTTSSQPQRRLPYATIMPLSNNQILLKSETTCILNEEHCINANGSESYWFAIPTDSCNFSEYDVLYEEPAVKLTSAVPTEGPTLFVVTSRDVTFTPTRTSDFALCKYTLVCTEHPKLLIMETLPDRTFPNPRHQ